MTKNYYKEGSWNVICDSCGKKRKREQCKKTWDGFLMCTVENCWYPKHPMFIPQVVKPDGLPVPDARPRPAQNFIPWPGTGLITWESTITWDDPTATWEDDISTVDLNDLIGR